MLNNQRVIDCQLFWLVLKYGTPKSISFWSFSSLKLSAILVLYPIFRHTHLILLDSWYGMISYYIPIYPHISPWDIHGNPISRPIFKPQKIQPRMELQPSGDPPGTFSRRLFKPCSTALRLRSAAPSFPMTSESSPWWLGAVDCL